MLALQERDAASRRFLRLHQQVPSPPPTPLSLFLQHMFLTQTLELKAEVAALETESNALRQQNRRLAARIVQLQVSKPSSRSLLPLLSQLPPPFPPPSLPLPSPSTAVPRNCAAGHAAGDAAAAAGRGLAVAAVQVPNPPPPSPPSFLHHLPSS
jgi:hypothetical protein